MIQLIGTLLRFRRSQSRSFVVPRRLIPASVVGVLAWGHVVMNENDPNALGSALFSIFIGLWTTYAVVYFVCFFVVRVLP